MQSNDTGLLAVGDSINLTCMATGEPLPLIQWYKGDVLVMNETSTKMCNQEFDRNNLTTSKLELRDLVVNNSGTYRCQAKNIAGNASEEFEVVIIPGIIIFTI